MDRSLLDSEFKYFLRVADAKTLLSASERLGISQPALSRAMDRLEEKVGFKVYLRSRTGIELTEQGHELLMRLRSLSEDLTGVIDEIRGKKAEVTGQIKITGHKSIIQDFMLPVYGKLSADFPKVQFHLETRPSLESLNAVLNRQVDIALAINPTEYNNLIIRQLAATQGGFYSKVPSPKKLFLNPQMIDLNKLFKVMRKDLLDESAIQFIDDYDIIAELVKKNLGCGLLPDHVGERFQLPEFSRYNQIIKGHYSLKLVGHALALSDSKRKIFRRLEELILAYGPN